MPGCGSTTMAAVADRDPSTVRDRLTTFVGPACIALVIAAAVPGLWRSAGAPMEEGFMLAFPQQLLHGRIPNRDFLHLYGPGSLWVLAAFYKVFGSTITMERLVGLAQHGVTCLGMYALLRPVSRRIATLGGVTCALILLTPLGLAALAWNGALACAVCGLALLIRVMTPSGEAVGFDPGWWRPVGGGVLVGLALLYRPDMVVALGAAAVLAAWWMTSTVRRRVLIGLVPTLALYIPHLVLAGVGASIKGMLIQPLVTLRPGRRLPVPPTWGTVDGYLQRTAALQVPNSWAARLLGTSQQIFLWFVVAVVVAVALVIGAWWLRRQGDRSPAANAVVVGGVWAALLITQAVQRPDSAHLAWVTGVSIPLVLALGVELRTRRSPSLRLPALVATATVGVFLVVIVPFFPLRAYGDALRIGAERAPGGYRITHGDRYFLFGSSDGARSAQRVVNRLAADSRPGQRLIVGPVDLSRTVYSDAYLYALFPELKVGTRYIEMDPGIADATSSQLASELHDGDWLILSRLWNSWNEPNTSTQHRSEAANVVVRRDYCLQLDAGGYELFRRCH